MRKGSSNVASVRRNYDYVDDEVEDDYESVVTYLTMVNEFIKANIQEELSEYLALKNGLKAVVATSPSEVEESPLSSSQQENVSPDQAPFVIEEETTTNTGAIILKKRKNQHRKPVAATPI